MGLIKAYIIILISWVITEYIYNFNKKYKNYPYYSMISPYLDSKSKLMIINMILILISI